MINRKHENKELVSAVDSLEGETAKERITAFSELFSTPYNSVKAYYYGGVPYPADKTAMLSMLSMYEAELKELRGS